MPCGVKIIIWKKLEQAVFKSFLFAKAVLFEHVKFKQSQCTWSAPPVKGWHNPNVAA